MAIPALCEKLPEWHFLTHTCNSKKFWAKLCTSFEVLWKCHQVTLFKKCLSPSAKIADKSGKIGFFSKMHHSNWQILFVLGAYE